MTTDLKLLAKFIYLLFWKFPMVIEPNRKIQFISVLLYGFVLGCAGLIPSELHPTIEADEFPTRAQASEVSGVLSRAQSWDTSIGKAEPIVIVHDRRETTLWCGRNHVCMFDDDWLAYEGSSAKAWYWKHWLVHLEVNGHAPNRLDIDSRRRSLTRTDLSFLVWNEALLTAILISWLSWRYGRLAFRRASGYDTHEGRPT